MSGQTLAAGYAGINDLDDFADAAELDRYRAALAERTIEARPIAAALAPGGRVFEAGCGSGRLLVELARRGAIAEGVGIDLSASRVAFAERWAHAARLAGLRFAVADALAPPVEAGRFDAAIGVGGVLCYCGATEPRTDGALLAGLRRVLRPGGTVWIEVVPHARKRALLEAGGGHLRLWEELPKPDPWQFYLSDLELRDAVMTHFKTFVHRHDGRIDGGRVERLRLYGPEEIEALLHAARFDAVECTAGWDGTPYDGGDVLVARARAA